MTMGAVSNSRLEEFLCLSKVNILLAVCQEFLSACSFILGDCCDCLAYTGMDQVVTGLMSLQRSSDVGVCYGPLRLDAGDLSWKYLVPQKGLVTVTDPLGGAQMPQTQDSFTVFNIFGLFLRFYLVT